MKILNNAFSCEDQSQKVHASVNEVFEDEKLFKTLKSVIKLKKPPRGLSPVDGGSGLQVRGVTADINLLRKKPNCMWSTHNHHPKYVSNRALPSNLSSWYIQ